MVGSTMANDAYTTCDDCGESYELDTTKLVLLQSDDGWVKAVCKTCLETYDKEQRTFH